MGNSLGIQDSAPDRVVPDGEARLVDIERMIHEHGIDTVKLGMVDIDGLWRGKRLPVEYFLRDIWRNGTQIANILFGWDVQDALIPGLAYTGWHTGYPDVALVPDLSTFTVVPWETNTAAVIADVVSPDGRPLGLSPRQLLKTTIERAARLGYRANIGYEFEFYIFKETVESAYEKRFTDLIPMAPGVHTYNLCRGTLAEPLIGELRRAMVQYGVPLEGCNSEAGPGQFEISLRYTDALAAADQAMLYKVGVKEIAAQRGYLASFMAKYHPDWSGSSGHIHQSLGDHESANVFHSSDSDDHLSDVARWYAGGLLKTMYEFTAFFCPTLNSYKRKLPGTWASTTATWGVDNRTTGLRVINASPKAARLEHRLAGADANPYIAVAASIAAGIWGIENKVEPPDLCDGNVYEAAGDDIPVLPWTLEEAVGALDGGDLARAILGREFVDHFIATRRWELECARSAVTDWERARYLEMI